MSRLAITVTGFVIWSSVACADDIKLTDPSVSVARIDNADFIPVGPDSPKTSDVFVIEFSSSENLRDWSMQIGALILSSFRTCSGDREVDSEGYFIADSKGVIAVSGIIISQADRMPLPNTVGRYTTLLFRRIGKADGRPYVEQLPGPICMRVGVTSADDLPNPWTKPLAISSDLLHAAWSDFVK